MTLTLLTLLMLLSTSSLAQNIPPILRPGTHPLWFGFGFGPAINIDKFATQFKLSQTLGYHFSGDASGPAIALDIQESFGEGITALELGPRFVWDIPIVNGLGFYLSPSGMFGFAHAGGGGSSANGFTLQFSFDGKLLLADRGFVFFRPFSLDIVGLGNGSFEVGLRYDMLFGGGVMF
jgi:hypothetical protein